MVFGCPQTRIIAPSLNIFERYDLRRFIRLRWNRFVQAPPPSLTSEELHAKAAALDSQCRFVKDASEILIYDAITMSEPELVRVSQFDSRPSNSIPFDGIGAKRLHDVHGRDRVPIEAVIWIEQQHAECRTTTVVFQEQRPITQPDRTRVISNWDGPHDRSKRCAVGLIARKPRDGGDNDSRDGRRSCQSTAIEPCEHNRADCTRGKLSVGRTKLHVTLTSQADAP